MNLNEKLKNYLTHEENDFLKVENSYNKKTSYLVGFEFASGSNRCFFEREYKRAFGSFIIILRLYSLLRIVHG